MSKDEEILEVIKELAKNRGKIISLSLIYRNVMAKGIYTFKANIKNALKRLETRREIKATGMDSIELLEE
jgi:hypothetical protein